MSSIPTLTNYTYSLWLKPTTYTSGATGDGTGTYFVDRTTATNALVSLKAVGGNYHYQFRSNTGTGIGTVAGGAIRNGEWQHVVWGKHGTEHFIYVNGVKSTTTGTSDITPPTPRLGAHQAGAYFDGVLDDFRVFDRALTDAEVAELYGVGGGSTIKICREASVQDADGNTYNTLAIGSQCWLDRNMNVGTRIAAAGNQTDNGTIEKYCYSNSDANCTTNNPNKPDGGLYQWNEAMQYSTTEGARGICPVGFHIPTDAEWHTLEKFLKDSGQSCNGNRSGAYDCSPAGTKLQPGGSSRFEGNRAGSVVSGSSLDRGGYGYWWSFSPSGGLAWGRYVASGEARVYRYASAQSYGFSVRCLQD